MNNQRNCWCLLFFNHCILKLTWLIFVRTCNVNCSCYNFHPFLGLQSLRKRPRKTIVQFWNNSCVILQRQVSQCEYSARTCSNHSNDMTCQAKITKLFCLILGSLGHSLKHTLCLSWKRSWMASMPQLLNREDSITPMLTMFPLNRWNRES